ncbi:MAG: hypothetical protein EOO24_64595 [Comamonadaceae bacterium]|nr:MAG: hypothetical protein EOO24_64595 [Comamonadaceae bacterium]
MPSHRLRQAWALVLAAACTAGAAVSHAQPAAFPSRPLTWVVPTPSGGILDTAGRQMAHKLAEKLGQPVVVDNKPGAGGMIAAEAVARAAPDGHTIFMGTQSTNGANAALFKSMRYDPAKDFIAVH